MSKDIEELIVLLDNIVEDNSESVMYCVQVFLQRTEDEKAVNFIKLFIQNKDISEEHRNLILEAFAGSRVKKFYSILADILFKIIKERERELLFTAVACLVNLPKGYDLQIIEELNKLLEEDVEEDVKRAIKAHLTIRSR